MRWREERIESEKRGGVTYVHVLSLSLSLSSIL